jgi:hypothetical protein
MLCLARAGPSSHFSERRQVDAVDASPLKLVDSIPPLMAQASERGIDRIPRSAIRPRFEADSARRGTSAAAGIRRTAHGSGWVDGGGSALASPTH